jgi:hypothetical protein
MDATVETAHGEKCLYPRIQELMESRGYAVIPQFETFSPLTGRKRKLDLLGFRWIGNGDLDAWAIEGKQGVSPADTLLALGQAIEYQLYVPRVSVAAEVPRENLAYAEGPLRQLGLGYIHATPTSATEIISPALSPRCYQNEFNEVIRHAGVLCLLGRERWKKENRREHHHGGDKAAGAAGYPFYVIHNNDPVQYDLTATGQSKEVRIKVWIESKKALTGIYHEIEAGLLAEHLGKLGADATTSISIYERDHFRRLRNCEGPRQLPPDKAGIAKALVGARAALRKNRIVPVISVALELWAWDATPRRAEAENAVEQAVKRLEPIRMYLAAMVS